MLPSCVSVYVIYVYVFTMITQSNDSMWKVHDIQYMLANIYVYRKYVYKTSKLCKWHTNNLGT